MELDIVSGIGHPENGATVYGASYLRGHIALSSGKFTGVL
jgi:hypothetical protein